MNGPRWYAARTKAGTATKAVHAFEPLEVVSVCGRARGRKGSAVRRSFLATVLSTPPPILNGNLVRRSRPCSACWRSA